MHTYTHACVHNKHTDMRTYIHVDACMNTCTYIQTSPFPLSHKPRARPPSRRLSRPPAAIYGKPASRPRKMRLSRKAAEKNYRLSRREKCGLITEKSIITVFNICKLFATVIFAVPCRRSCVFFVFMFKTHLYFHCTAVITKRTHDLR